MADFPLPFLLFGGFVAFVIFLGIIAQRQEKKRQEVLAQFALARQWFFEPDKVRGFDAKYLDFDFLDRGTNRYAHNILAGSHRDCVVEAFEIPFLFCSSSEASAFSYCSG